MVPCGKWSHVAVCGGWNCQGNQLGAEGGSYNRAERHNHHFQGDLARPSSRPNNNFQRKLFGSLRDLWLKVMVDILSWKGVIYIQCCTLAWLVLSSSATWCLMKGLNTCQSHERHFVHDRAHVWNNNKQWVSLNSSDQNLPRNIFSFFTFPIWMWP